MNDISYVNADSGLSDSDVDAIFLCCMAGLKFENQPRPLDIAFRPHDPNDEFDGRRSGEFTPCVTQDGPFKDRAFISVYVHPASSMPQVRVLHQSPKDSNTLYCLRDNEAIFVTGSEFALFCLAHELRHAWQWWHWPKEKLSGRPGDRPPGYIESELEMERDADEYAELVLAEFFKTNIPFFNQVKERRKNVGIR